jgi:hypothetical protein
MPLPNRAKELLLAPFAISPIIARFALPALIGFLIFAVGLWQQTTWLKVIGVVLAAPVLWAFAALFFVYCPILIVEGIRRRLNKTK